VPEPDFDAARKWAERYAASCAAIRETCPSAIIVQFPGDENTARAFLALDAEVTKLRALLKQALGAFNTKESWKAVAAEIRAALERKTDA